jgi:hypothetical protein
MCEPARQKEAGQVSTGLFLTSLKRLLLGTNKDNQCRRYSEFTQVIQCW